MQGRIDVDDAVATPQRVALLGSFAPSLINFRGPLIAAMIARGHQVFAMAPDIDPETARQLEALGASPVSVPLEQTSLNPFAGARSIGALKRTFARIRPDVLIAYTIKPIVLGGPAARAAGVPRFVPLVTGLGYAFTEGREPRRLIARAAASLLYRRAFGYSNAAIFQNPDDLSEFHRRRLLPAKLRTAIVNGSGIDLDHFAPVPPPPAPSFLMVARLLGDKGVREYAEAAVRLLERHPQVRISLAGWIDPSPNAINQAELDAIVNSGVQFLGRLADVRDAIATHRVYVLPSYREGTPRSVLEAMAIGRAIITTDAPGCRETVIEGENGMLVRPRNSDSLYRAMVRFVEQPALAEAMGPASRRLAERKYDVHKINREVLHHSGL